MFVQMQYEYLNCLYPIWWNVNSQTDSACFFKLLTSRLHICDDVMFLFHVCFSCLRYFYHNYMSYQWIFLASLVTRCLLNKFPTWRIIACLLTFAHFYVLQLQTPGPSLQFMLHLLPTSTIPEYLEQNKIEIKCCKKQEYFSDMGFRTIVNVNYVIKSGIYRLQRVNWIVSD